MQFHAVWFLVCLLCFLIEAAPTTPQNIGGTCPTGWVAWGSDCYLVPVEFVYYWEDAKIRCQVLAGTEYKATLASIHSYMENKFIYDLFVATGYTSDYYNSGYIGFTQDTSKYNFILLVNGEYRSLVIGL